MRISILTDSTDTKDASKSWRASFASGAPTVAIHFCNPLVVESWAGFVTSDVVIACIRPDTANNAQIREVLRGQRARVYVLTEDNS
jgi:hypothetical protein